MFKRRIICSIIAILLLVLCSFIDRWAGFSKGYFAISAAIVASIYFFVEFILDTIDYYKSYKPEFKIFVAEKVNKTDLTYDMIMSKKKYYYKQFKRTKLGGLLYQYVKLSFVFGIMIIFFVYLF